MEWREIAVVVFQTSSLVLLCVVWFMIGKYRALCRKVRTHEHGREGVVFAEQVGSVRREVTVYFQDSKTSKQEALELLATAVGVLRKEAAMVQE